MTEREALRKLHSDLKVLTAANRQQAVALHELDQAISEVLLDHYAGDDLLRCFHQIIARPGELTKQDDEEIKVLTKVFTEREKAQSN